MRKYVSKLNKQLNSKNVLFLSWWTLVHNSFHFSIIVYLFGTTQEACLTPSRRTFAFYLLGYLLLVITPSVAFIGIFPCKDLYLVNAWITWIHPYCRGWYTGLNMRPICFWFLRIQIFNYESSLDSDVALWGRVESMNLGFKSKLMRSLFEPCISTNKICSWILRWIFGGASM